MGDSCSSSNVHNKTGTAEELLVALLEQHAFVEKLKRQKWEKKSAKRDLGFTSSPGLLQ